MEQFQKRACFERVVAIARWKAEASRAQTRGAPMHVAAASAGVDFSGEAVGAAATNPWTATMVAVWQWGKSTLNNAHLGGDTEMRYALRTAPYRHFCSMPQSLLPTAG